VDWHTLLRLGEQMALALLCGAALGWEREAKRKPAGLRTHMLVALGACAFTLATNIMVAGGGREAASVVDPARTVAGIIGGIGFLGAGTIIRSGSHVEGITTAATIWVTGAVGLACGIGRSAYAVAVLTTVASLFALRCIALLEWWIRRVAALRSKRDAADDDAPSQALASRGDAP
jgi:putative Mg2+ transporter-C (MgtC) family protein